MSTTPPPQGRRSPSPQEEGTTSAAGQRARRARLAIGRPREHATLGLALGGGGARGFAHVVVMEALDELGVRPAAIAGTSIGAAVGAAYASGLSGKAMRRIVTTLAHERAETFGRLLGARATGLRALLAARFGNLMLLDAEKLCAAFMPASVPKDFSELAIPLTVLATDLYGRCAVPLTTGPLRPAIAASMAVPGLVRPVTINGRVLVDGGAVEPLPFECLRSKVDVILAVDASAAVKGREGEIPDPWECLFATLQIMGRSILNEKLRHGGPDVLVRPNVGTFRMLDFLRGTAILRAADPIKEEVKESVRALIRA